MIKSMATSYFTTTTFQLFNNLFTKPNEKNSIIDPLTCMIRLAVLSFKPIGTKISVNDNKIKFCEPSFFQGPLRWSYGDNREDLHNIFNPIKKALIWYDISDKTVKDIFLLSIRGIDKLKKAYKDNSMITHSLEHYITFIDSSMTNFESYNKPQENNNIFNELQTLWNINEIKIINNILTEMQTNTDEDELYALINAIESILITKELKVKKIIIENTTQIK